MRLTIVPYTACMVGAVKEFNRRLKARGSPWKLTENPVPDWLPKSDGIDLYQEYFLAVDECNAVRGGYALKQQTFAVQGKEIPVGVCRMPVSEGIVDPAYGLVGGILLRDALRRQPYLYALGMGGLETPYARLLHRALKWAVVLIPFYFHARHVGPLLHQLTLFHSSRSYQMARALMEWTRGGPSLVHAGQTILELPTLFTERVDVQPFSCFDAWADRLWESSRQGYSMIAVRTMAVLNRLYPAGHPAHRLRVLRHGRDIGWAVVLDTQMKAHPHFGDLRVGSIVDCLALPGAERAVIKASARFLHCRGVDLIVSNQNHLSWRRAMMAAGFLRGVSNFAFGVSNDLQSLLDPLERSMRKVHVTRGDGDGPINL